MKVRAIKGARCPMEGQPRKYILDTFVDVPDTAYYRRLVRDGSLEKEKVSGKQLAVSGEKK